MKWMSFTCWLACSSSTLVKWMELPLGLFCKLLWRGCLEGPVESLVHLGRTSLPGHHKACHIGGFDLPLLQCDLSSLPQPIVLSYCPHFHKILIYSSPLSVQRKSTGPPTSNPYSPPPYYGSPAMQCTVAIWLVKSGGSKGGTRDTYPRVQILSISCSFWEILAKSYVGSPPPGLVPPTS